MSDLHAAAERAIATHPGFDRDGDRFLASGTPFEASVQLAAADASVRYEVRVVLPTLDAVVVGERVATVVERGWFETFERRLEDLNGALRAQSAETSIERDAAAETITVRSTFESARPDHGVEDATALIGYVEGTYLEGVIPGYTYREPVAGLLEQARERSGGVTDG